MSTPSRLTRRNWVLGATGTLVAGRQCVRAQEAAPFEVLDRPQVARIASGSRAAAATVHPRATAAAMEMFARGGNAADAAVAAALMLAVVDGHNSGLGGGCFVLARAADGTTVAIDGRETAPAAAFPKMYYRDGSVDPELSRTGALASGVPGALAAYHELATTLGTGRWADAIELAADTAEVGFVIRPEYAERLAEVADDLARFPAAAKIFLAPDGRPKAAGETLVQHDLARTLRELTEGPEPFYRGRFATQLDRWMQANGGALRQSDLAAYRTVRREPITTTLRQHQLVGFPPPSSGGIHVAQILAMLERFDLAELYAEQPTTFWHLVAEAMRRAFADRAKWLGDPDFADVPRGLIDPDYLSNRSVAIRERERTVSVAAGLPPRADSWLFGDREAQRHTTHLTTADKQGNWIAITTTINTTFGSKVVVPETGVVLNNEMDDFAIAPGVPNAFGLIGREANAPAAGKRPLSSMSPTIVIKNNQPVLTCGAAGGPRIISAVMQIVLRVIGLNQDLATAIQGPRIHHQWRPDELLVETGFEDSVVEGLRRLGHRVNTVGDIGKAQAIALESSGQLIAASEPRLPSSAAAF